ncbi:MAG: murein biosynthesis integral membrane protein MurJ, partial [Verrucomicrobiota bacterium]|nr:murein biosynthesis integral membrane protein MurJ [Verrucomicrobiota bacterium]
GLVRDAMIFASLGSSIWSSAFILAFTLPNLFRRLFGEGALTSALVPTFSDVLQRDGRMKALGFFNQVFLRAIIVLLAILIAGVISLGLIIKLGNLSQRWVLGAELAMGMLPYMLFICLAAIVSVVLNIFGRFAVAALTPVILNLSIILAICFGICRDSPQNVLVWLICGGVLCGGILQFLLPSYSLFKQGWRPAIISNHQFNQSLRELWELFLPGLLGAAILQINILVSRLLAFSLNDTAASELYLASRLMELPLGVFTIAIVTVFFPLMAKSLTSGDDKGFAESFNSGMRLVLAISFPASIGLFIFNESILRALFQWGAFDSSSVLKIAPLVAIYGLGLPFYSVAIFATRGLYAAKNMSYPVKVAGLCLALNALLGILLMQFLAERGLAIANVLSATVQASMLWFALLHSHALICFKQIWDALKKVIIASLIMGIICCINLFFISLLGMNPKSEAYLVVAFLIPSATLVYFALLYFLDFEELSNFQKILKHH